MPRLPRFLDDLPIRRKLAWLAAAASMLGLLLFGLAAGVLLRWSAQQSVEQQVATLRPLLSAALVGPMIERDYAAVREIAQQLVKSDAIEAITVVSTEGAAVVDVQTPASSSFSLERNFELEESAVSFGQVRLRISAGGFAQLLSRLGVAMLLAAILSLSLVTFLFRLLSRRLTARLSSLAATAHEISAGRFAARVEEAAQDEIGQLAQDFNRMAETVQATVQELAASEGELSAILQSIGDGLLTTDPTMRVTYMNPVAEALTGWSEEEARGRSIAEIFKIQNALTGLPAEIPVGRVLETGLVVGLANHTVLIAKDGRRHHISDSAAPIRDGSGRLLGVVMVFRDITESYRLRADLDASRTRLELALKGANLGLWDRDLETDRLVVDARWAGMLGYRQEDFAAKVDPWIALIHPDDLPSVRRAFKEHLEGRSPQYEAEFRMRAKDGQWRWILSRGRVTERDAEGRPLRVTGTHLDITERHAAQEEIERLAFFDALTQLPNRRLLLD
ncbi:MAG: PAS domain-containing protein, partial [Rhodocyclaceae bacterium]